jgi:hypothetical protein
MLVKRVVMSLSRDYSQLPKSSIYSRYHQHSYSHFLEAYKPARRPQISSTPFLHNHTAATLHSNHFFKTRPPPVLHATYTTSNQISTCKPSSAAVLPYDTLHRLCIQSIAHTSKPSTPPPSNLTTLQKVHYINIDHADARKKRMASVRKRHSSGEQC